MPKVAFGIPHYGPQPAEWWVPLVMNIAALHKQGIEFWSPPLTSGVSTTDINRNRIVHTFLHETDAEWLFWTDADNSPPVGAIPRLLATGYKIVSGLYYGGSMDTELIPIAYLKNKQGAYHTLDDVYQWERGEIVPVDAVGSGCCLVHRSVYEVIEAEYAIFQRLSGGVTCVRKKDIRGEVLESTRHPYDGQVHKGVLYERLVPVTIENPKFPFYICQYGRSEDMWFCELAKSVGFPIMLDTSVEVGHVKTKTYVGKDFREQKGLVTNPSVQEIVYQWEAK